MARKDKRVGKFKRASLQFARSIWLFPALLTFILVLAVVLKISGTSVGMYHNYFTGNPSSTDANLVVGEPRGIRSDEWIVNTQMTIAQTNNGFDVVNDNIGNGIDMSVVIDAPFLDWSQLFKPHNLAFFVLPAEHAFAFKWWFMAYALALSVYFFVLLLLPGRKKIAALLAVAMVAAPMVQWWYQYITLAPIYNGLFAATMFILLLRARSLWSRIGLAAALGYFAVSFALVRYPAFQIPVLLVIAAFIIGHIIHVARTSPEDKKLLKYNLSAAIGAAVIAVGIVGLFIYQKSDVVSDIRNTVYPGARHIVSGGFNALHFFSGNLAFQMQRDGRAGNYQISEIGATNQSESSNFIYLFPFLLIPLLAVYWLRGKIKGKKIPAIDPRIVATFVGAGVLLAWLFVPNIPLLGSLTFLEIVPTKRALLGLGVANTILIALFIAEYLKNKTLNYRFAIIYSFIVLLFYAGIGTYWHTTSPLFISLGFAIVLALPIPAIIFLLLRKKFTIALGIFALFSIFSVFAIHPLYRGLDPLLNTPLVQELKAVDNPSKKRWLSEGTMIENFAFMSGQPSITGVFPYPDLELWDGLDQPDQEAVYNRYAHVNFTLKRDGEPIKQATISNPGADSMNISMDPCDAFLSENNVDYILTTKAFMAGDASCMTLIKTVPYPSQSFYFYQRSAL